MFRVFGHVVIHSEVWAAVEATIADLQKQVNAVQRETMRNTQSLRKLAPAGPPEMPTVAETRIFELIRAYAPGELRGRVTSGGMPRYPLDGESANTTESGE